MLGYLRCRVSKSDGKRLGGNMIASRRSILRMISASAIAGNALSPFGKSYPATIPECALTDKGDKPIRLDKNENPYGPSAKAVAAMQQVLSCTHRYPDGAVLTGKIAGVHRVKPEQVVLGCGSSEILRLACEAFLSSSKKLILASPTYNLMTEYAAARRAKVVPIPLNPQYEHDLQRMLAQADDSTGLIYICNP